MNLILIINCRILAKGTEILQIQEEQGSELKLTLKTFNYKLNIHLILLF